MVLVDMEHKQYREAYSLLWFEVPGGWLPLPEIEYISVFSAKIRSTFRSRWGNETNIMLKEIQVNFIHGKNKVIKAYKAEEKDDAIAVAKQFSVALGGKRILDATQKPFVWLDE